MAKFTGKSMTLTIGDTNITCLSSVSIDESVDMYEVECAGATSKVHIAGLSNISGSFSIFVDQASETLLDILAPGTAYEDSVGGITDAFTFLPAGNTSTYLEYDSTKVTITSRSIATSVTGPTAVTVNFVLDDLDLDSVA